MKYDEWLDEWLELYVKPVKKRSTYLRYESALRLHVRPCLGQHELTRLDGRVLQKSVIRMLECGHLYSGGGLAEGTILQIVRIVRESLAQAERVGLLCRGCGDEICRPRCADAIPKVKCFTVREQKTIERLVLQQDDRRLYGVILTLYLGLRIGELLALTWADVDFRRGLLTVNKTCHDSWGGGYRKLIETPKTQSSYRTIPIPRQILPYLRALRKDCDSLYVIHNAAGKEISVRSYQRSFERLLERARIRHLGFHALRHTFATRAIENNVDVKTLSEVMGHRSPAVTLAIYAHSLAPHKRVMMNRLGKLLSDSGIREEE